MSAETAPLIVSALLGAADFAWLDALRRSHYPPDRNRLPAHLTLFHHLPPSLAPELRRRLAEVARNSPPRAEAAGLINLGTGVAVKIVSPGLNDIRNDLVEAFRGLLTPQDAAGWRAHVTIQNKVSPHEATALLRALRTGFAARPVTIEGLALHRYCGGPWEPVSRHLFRG
ncbi:MAG TPA: 2'-5' RNA ligase family protein [Sphingomonas sp.]|nr:2'-5' RNA ligase family protein [Sphingomonas sp.]